MKKIAIQYYPSAKRWQKYALWFALPVSIIGSLLRAAAQDRFEFSSFAGITCFTYAATWFGIWGAFMVATEMALLFDSGRRDEMWSWWFAALSLLMGFAFALCSVSWICILYCSP